MRKARAEAGLDNLLNFQEIEYTDSRGRKQPAMLVNEVALRPVLRSG
jgi:hypothetical protein